MTDYPQCPECETDLLVGKTRDNGHRYKCYGCGEHFGRIDTEPVDWHAVDRWYQIDSEFSATLHADAECGSLSKTDKPIMQLTTTEAKTHHLGRCQKCGWVDE